MNFVGIILSLIIGPLALAGITGLLRVATNQMPKDGETCFYDEQYIAAQDPMSGRWYCIDPKTKTFIRSIERSVKK